MPLKDYEIRTALIERLKHLSTPPSAIIEELRVHEGNAVADVVTIHKGMHCYEIKGETDSIYRIRKQSIYYNFVFKKITLITTKNHLAAALKNSPAHWGVIVAECIDKKIKFKYLRKASQNKNYSKELALLTLWKHELLNNETIINSQANFSKFSRVQLSNIIAKSASIEKIDNFVSSQLLARQKTSGWPLSIKAI